MQHERVGKSVLPRSPFSKETPIKSYNNFNFSKIKVTMSSSSKTSFGVQPICLPVLQHPPRPAVLAVTISEAGAHTCPSLAGGRSIAAEISTLGFSGLEPTFC